MGVPRHGNTRRAAGGPRRFRRPPPPRPSAGGAPAQMQPFSGEALVREATRAPLDDRAAILAIPGGSAGGPAPRPRGLVAARWPASHRRHGHPIAVSLEHQWPPIRSGRGRRARSRPRPLRPHPRPCRVRRAHCLRQGRRGRCAQTTAHVSVAGATRPSPAPPAGARVAGATVPCTPRPSPTRRRGRRASKRRHGCAHAGLPPETPQSPRPPYAPLLPTLDGGPIWPRPSTPRSSPCSLRR
jgi:hypothetical protein